jgi:hypothetical protein
MLEDDEPRLEELILPCGVAYYLSSISEDEGAYEAFSSE